jgi:hypothetical protein
MMFFARPMILRRYLIENSLTMTILHQQCGCEKIQRRPAEVESF